ncbi:succinate-semialdehyde dehydrogenase [Colletotrichum graminicola M1.001]|uniref:Succinate-semialdehyde dehydrogenase n=1 Tax=Colletotrichum graminicola (strain M1.001 / M2 / FGSC 10212) TaxID=645133 RepID=E3QNI3_COLGM|nr:succinate-semialdehyde dehydrogenase [Colletotrichum graminicola M1.001]EFQ32470.1 succinate-semialdehyde dehydrogenase [Colletotrichum graminicola M1.001]
MPERLENGKASVEMKGEVVRALSIHLIVCRRGGALVQRHYPVIVRNTTALAFKEPVSVCGITTPCKFSVALVMRKIEPVFATGCSVIIKASKRNTPFNTPALATFALAADVPQFLVHEKFQYELIKKIAQRVEGYRLVQDIDEGTTHGPLVNAAAFQKLDAHVKGAPAKGAVLHTAEKFPGVTIEMGVAHDEIFGPLAAIVPFGTETKAVELVNAMECGLAGNCSSWNISRDVRVA